MTDSRTQALQFASTHKDDFLSFLKELVSIPSISTDPEKKSDINKCANLIANKLTSVGIEHVQIIPTAGNPVVYGDYLHAGSDKPVVLIYGHYDVQPEDPIELWETEPFHATQKEDYLLGRGVSDMKGQFSSCISAIESILQTGEFPVNIKFALEGEEEIGSPSFHDFLIENKSLVQADIVVNPDAGMVSKDQPAIIYGLRGLAYFEVRVFGPNRDLHSGSFGGVVHNPAQVLCDLISGMHDADGKITLPGFYDSVHPISEQEHEELERLNLTDQYYYEQTGVKQIKGEKGFTSIERIGARPTLEINGLLSGFTGHGGKTIIPAKAMAKISSRLVPYQRPEQVHQQLIEYFKRSAPPTVDWEIEMISGGNPSISDINLPETKALASALETVWGVKPVYKREGGSISVTSDFQEILGIDSVLTGFGLPDDNIHSPNEHLHLPTWQKGIQALIHFFYNIPSKKEATS